jgi:hypothetical protein
VNNHVRAWAAFMCFVETRHSPALHVNPATVYSAGIPVRSITYISKLSTKTKYNDNTPSMAADDDGE